MACMASLNGVKVTAHLFGIGIGISILHNNTYSSTQLLLENEHLFQLWKLQWNNNKVKG